MRYIKLLIESVYLVDPDSLNVIYPINFYMMDEKENSSGEMNASELFDQNTFDLLKSKIQFLMLNEKLDETTLILERKEIEGNNLLSIKLTKMQYLGNLILEIKVGEVKKIKFRETIIVKELTRSFANLQDEKLRSSNGS